MSTKSTSPHETATEDSVPEKGDPSNPWTLREFVGLVRDHADLLASTAHIMQAPEKPEADLLALAQRRATAAKRELWAVESNAQAPELAKVLPAASMKPGDEAWRLHRALFLLPLVVVALDHARRHPDADLEVGPAFRWAEHGLADAASDLHGWADAHTKEVAT